MSSVTCQMSISLDGFVAWPNQSLENPIGEGGMRLHQWMFETASWKGQHGEAGGARSADSDVVEELLGVMAPTSWAARCSAAGMANGTRPGLGGGATSRPTIRPSLS